MRILHNYLCGAAAVLFASTATAQIIYNESFPVDEAGWTFVGGFESGWYNDGTECDALPGNLRINIYGGAANGEIISPAFPGRVAGLPQVMTYTYKVHAWAANTAPVNPWGTCEVQITEDAGATWTTVDTFTDEVQTAGCITRQAAFTATTGVGLPTDELQVRFNITHNNGDYFFNVDDVDIQIFSDCSGAPAPGDTIVAGEICNGAGTANLSLQNDTSGNGVSYQWYESTVSSTGPWNALGTGSTESLAVTGTTYFYCDVTCAASATTTSSNVGMIDGTFTLQNPQPWDNDVTDNCWENNPDFIGTSMDIYWDMGDALGGAGCVEFDFWGAFTVGDQGTLTSPIFTPLAGPDTLYFDAAGAYYSGFAIPTEDKIIFEESSDGGLTWGEITRMSSGPGGLLNTVGDGGGFFDTPAAGDWVNRNIPLSAGANRFRFRAKSDYGNQIFIDNWAIGILPAARHTPYGDAAACVGMELSSATPPIFDNPVQFDVTGSPETDPLAPGLSIGINIISFTPDFAGTDLSLFGLLDAGCLVHVGALDILQAYVLVGVPGGPVDGVAGGYTIPTGSAAPGTTLYQQCATLVPATPTNSLGIVLSNGLETFLNAY